MNGCRARAVARLVKRVRTASWHGGVSGALPPRAQRDKGRREEVEPGSEKGRMGRWKGSFARSVLGRCGRRGEHLCLQALAASGGALDDVDDVGKKRRKPVWIGAGVGAVAGAEGVTPACLPVGHARERAGNGGRHGQF